MQTAAGIRRDVATTGAPRFELFEIPTQVGSLNVCSSCLWVRVDEDNMWNTVGADRDLRIGLHHVIGGILNDPDRVRTCCVP